MSGRREHTCSWCGRTDEWTDEWSQWGTADECVFTACSDACAKSIEPSTRFIGKPQNHDGSGKWFRATELERARRDLAERRSK